MPRMAFMGVRISWLTLARNSSLARFAASATSLARRNSVSKRFRCEMSRATEMREALQQKNFAMGLSQVYARKLSLLKTRPEYVWLGDYPKEAERRKQGYTMPVGVK